MFKKFECGKMWVMMHMVSQSYQQSQIMISTLDPKWHPPWDLSTSTTFNHIFNKKIHIVLDSIDIVINGHEILTQHAPKLVCQVKFTSLSVGPRSPNRKEIILFSYPTTLAALTLIIYIYINVEISRFVFNFIYLFIYIFCEDYYWNFIYILFVRMKIEISGLSKVDGLKYINKYLFIYLFL